MTEYILFNLKHCVLVDCNTHYLIQFMLINANAPYLFVFVPQLSFCLRAHTFYPITRKEQKLCHNFYSHDS